MDNIYGEDETEEQEDVEVSLYELILSSPYIGAIVGVVFACLTFGVLFSLFTTFRQAESDLGCLKRQRSSPDRPSRRPADMSMQAKNSMHKETGELRNGNEKPLGRKSFGQFIKHGCLSLQNRLRVGRLVSSFECVNANSKNTAQNTNNKNRPNKLKPEQESRQLLSFKDRTDSLTQNRKRTRQHIVPIQGTSKCPLSISQSEPQKKAPTSEQTYTWSPGSAAPREVGADSNGKNIKLIFPQTDSFELNITCLKIDTPERRSMLEDKRNIAYQDDQESSEGDVRLEPLVKDEEPKELYSVSNNLDNYFSPHVSVYPQALDSVPTRDTFSKELSYRPRYNSGTNVSQNINKQCNEGKPMSFDCLEDIEKKLVLKPTKTAIKHQSSKHKLSRNIFSEKRPPKGQRRYPSQADKYALDKEDKCSNLELGTFDREGRWNRKPETTFDEYPVDQAARGESSCLPFNQRSYKRCLAGGQGCRTFNDSFGEKKPAFGDLVGDKRVGFISRFNVPQHSRESHGCSNEGRKYKECLAASLDKQTKASWPSRSLTENGLSEPEHDVSYRDHGNQVLVYSVHEDNEVESSGRSAPSYSWSLESDLEDREHPEPIFSCFPSNTSGLIADRPNEAQPKCRHGNIALEQRVPKSYHMRQSSKTAQAVPTRTTSSRAGKKHDAPTLGVDQLQNSPKHYFQFARKKQISQEPDTSSILSQRLGRNIVQTLTPASNSSSKRDKKYCENYGNSANALLYSSPRRQTEDNWTSHSGQGRNETKANIKQRITYRQCSAVRESQRNVPTFTLPRIRSDDIHKNKNPSSKQNRHHARSHHNRMYMRTRPVHKGEKTSQSFVSLNACSKELKSLISSTIMDMQKYKSHVSSRRNSQLVPPRQQEASSTLIESSPSNVETVHPNNLARNLTGSNERSCTQRAVPICKSKIHDRFTEKLKIHSKSIRAKDGISTLESENIRDKDHVVLNNRKLQACAANASENSTSPTNMLLRSQIKRKKQQHTEDAATGKKPINTGLKATRVAGLARMSDRQCQYSSLENRFRINHPCCSETGNLQKALSQIPLPDTLMLCQTENTALINGKVSKSKRKKTVPDKDQKLHIAFSACKIQESNLQAAQKPEIGEPFFKNEVQVTDTAKRFPTKCTSETIANYIYEKYGKIFATNKQKREKILNIIKKKVRKRYLGCKPLVNQHQEEDSQRCADFQENCVPGVGLNPESMSPSQAFHHECLTQEVTSLYAQYCQLLNLKTSHQTNHSLKECKYPLTADLEVNSQSHFAKKTNDVGSNAAMTFAEAPTADFDIPLHREIQQEGVMSKRHHITPIPQSCKRTMAVASGVARREEGLLKTKELGLAQHKDNKGKSESNSVTIHSGIHFKDLKPQTTDSAGNAMSFDGKIPVESALACAQNSPSGQDPSYLNPTISPRDFSQDKKGLDSNASRKSKTNFDVLNIPSVRKKQKIPLKLDNTKILSEIKRQPLDKRKSKLWKDFVTIHNSDDCLAIPIYRSHKNKWLQNEPCTPSFTGGLQQCSQQKHISPTVKNTNRVASRNTRKENHAERSSLDVQDHKYLPATNQAELHNIKYSPAKKQTNMKDVKYLSVINLRAPVRNPLQQEDDNCSRASSVSYTISDTKVVVLQDDRSCSDRSCASKSSLVSTSIRSLYVAEVISSTSTLVSSSDIIKLGEGIAFGQGILEPHLIGQPTSTCPDRITNTQVVCPLTMSELMENNFISTELNEKGMPINQDGPVSHGNVNPSFDLKTRFSTSPCERPSVRNEKDGHKWMVKSDGLSSQSGGTLVEDNRRKSLSDNSISVSSWTYTPTNSRVREETIFAESKPRKEDGQDAVQIKMERNPERSCNSTNLIGCNCQEKARVPREGRKQFTYRNSQPVQITLSPPSIIFDGEQVSYMEIIPKDGIFNGLRLSELDEIPFSKILKISPTDKIWTPETGELYFRTLKQQTSRSSASSSVSHLLCILRSSSSRTSVSCASDTWSKSAVPGVTSTPRSLSDRRESLYKHLLLIRNSMAEDMSSLHEPGQQMEANRTLSESGEEESAVKAKTRAITLNTTPEFVPYTVCPTLSVTTFSGDKNLKSKMNHRHKNNEHIKHLDNERDSNTLLDQTCQTPFYSSKANTRGQSQPYLACTRQRMILARKAKKDGLDMIPVSDDSWPRSEENAYQTPEILPCENVRKETLPRTRNTVQEKLKPAAQHQHPVLEISSTTSATEQCLKLPKTSTRNESKPKTHKKGVMEDSSFGHTEDTSAAATQSENDSNSSSTVNGTRNTRNHHPQLNPHDLIISFQAVNMAARGSGSRIGHRINSLKKFPRPKLRDGLRHNAKDSKDTNTSVRNPKDTTALRQKHNVYPQKDKYKSIHFKTSPSTIKHGAFGQSTQTHLSRSPKFHVVTSMNTVKLHETHHPLQVNILGSRGVFGSAKVTATMCSSKPIPVALSKYTNTSFKPGMKSWLRDANRCNYTCVPSMTTLHKGSTLPCKRYQAVANCEGKTSSKTVNPHTKEHHKIPFPRTAHRQRRRKVDDLDCTSKGSVPLASRNVTRSGSPGRASLDVLATNKTSPNRSLKFSLGKSCSKRNRLGDYACLKPPHVDVYSSPKRSFLSDRSNSHNSSSILADKSLVLNSATCISLVSGHDLMDDNLHPDPRQAPKVSAISKSSEENIELCMGTNDGVGKTSGSEYTVAAYLGAFSKSQAENLGASSKLQAENLGAFSKTQAENLRASSKSQAENLGASSKSQAENYPLVPNERKIKSRILTKNVDKINFCADRARVGSTINTDTHQNVHRKNHNLCYRPQGLESTQDKPARLTRRDCHKGARTSIDARKQQVSGVTRQHVRFEATVDNRASILHNKAATDILHNKAATGILHNKVATDILHNKAATGILHNKVATSILHNKAATGILHNKAATGISHNKAATGILHNKAATGILHNKAATGILHKKAATSILHNKAATGILHNKAATDILHNKAATSILHNKAATDILHNKAATSILHNKVATDISHNKAATSILHNKAATGILHNKAATSILHNKAATDILHNKVATGILHNKVATGILHNKVATKTLPSMKQIKGWSYCRSGNNRRRYDTSRQESQDDTNRQESQDDTNRQKSQDDTNRQESQYDTNRQESQDGTNRQESQDNTSRQESQDDTNRQESQDDTSRQESQDDTSRQESQYDTNRQESQDDTNRQESQDDTNRQESQDDTNRQESQTVFQVKNISDYSKSPCHLFHLTNCSHGNQVISPEKLMDLQKMDYSNENKYLRINQMDRLVQESFTCENSSRFRKRLDDSYLPNQNGEKKERNLPTTRWSGVSCGYQTEQPWENISSKFAELCQDKSIWSSPKTSLIKDTLQKPITFTATRFRCFTSEESNVITVTSTDDSSIFHNTTDDVSASAIFDNSSPVVEFPRRTFQILKNNCSCPKLEFPQPPTQGRQQDSLQKSHTDKIYENLKHQGNYKCVPKLCTIGIKRWLPPGGVTSPTTTTHSTESNWVPSADFTES